MLHAPRLATCYINVIPPFFFPSPSFPQDLTGEKRKRGRRRGGQFTQSGSRTDELSFMDLYCRNIWRAYIERRIGGMQMGFGSAKLIIIDKMESWVKRYATLDRKHYSLRLIEMLVRRLVFIERFVAGVIPSVNWLPIIIISISVPDFILFFSSSFLLFFSSFLLSLA